MGGLLFQPFSLNIRGYKTWIVSNIGKELLLACSLSPSSDSGNAAIFSPYLQQLRHHRQLLRVADVDGVVPVGLPLVANVAQVKDGRQQREDP